MKRFDIYADGACHPNPGKDSWAAIIVDIDAGTYREISGRSEEDKTTNQRMKIQAELAQPRLMDQLDHRAFNLKLGVPNEGEPWFTVAGGGSWGDSRTYRVAQNSY